MCRFAVKKQFMLMSLLLFLAQGFDLSNHSTNNNRRLPALLRSSRNEDNYDNGLISFKTIRNKRILVVGGSGRVGGSVVTQLLSRGCNHVVVGGTNVDRFETSRMRWKQMFPSCNFDDNTSFVVLNREEADSVARVLEAEGAESMIDLVVHTAGPFQGKVSAPNGVLEACVKSGVPYVDVCDDYCTASAAKTKYARLAEEAGVPCIISTGCWPGVSSLMAKQLVRNVLQSDPTVKPEDLSVKFSFFTAGSGGAGVTLLVATFLILAEKALTVVRGRRLPVQAMKDYSQVSFGPNVGARSVAHLNLLETASVHDTLGVGSVQSLFGTAPAFWNALLGFMAQFPPSLLANESLMQKLAVFSMPLVRLVDTFAGATNAMRVDIVKKNDDSFTAIYAHDNLEPCVGECVVAFAAAVLSNDDVVRPGVWFPEQAIDGGSRAAEVLALASVGAHTAIVEQSTSNDTTLLTREEIWGKDVKVPAMT